jgi:hypothetical protein
MFRRIAILSIASACLAGCSMAQSYRRPRLNAGFCHLAHRPGLVRLRAYLIREVQVLSRSALQPVTACNCDAVRRGGEQQEVNDQSVG